MLYPQSRRALESQPAESALDWDQSDIDRRRDEARKAAAQMAREEVHAVADVSAGGVPCRAYLPVAAPDAVIVHLHGGGFVFNDVDVHDAAARLLANRSGMAVLSVDYRRPPEHPFPAAVRDVDAVLAWLGEYGAEHGLVGPTYLHGDSAGANLALVGALRNPGRTTGLVLLYPFLDPTCGFSSYATSAAGFGRSEAQWYWRQYAGDTQALSDPDLAPLRSDRLGTLPPTLVTTAEHDPLRGEGEHLARRAADLGVEVVATRYQGQLHGFWRHPDAFDAAVPMTWQVAGFLRELTTRRR